MKRLPAHVLTSVLYAIVYNVLFEARTFKKSLPTNSGGHNSRMNLTIQKQSNLKTFSSISSSYAIAIGMLHVWAELIDYCSLRLANQYLTGKIYCHTLQRGTAGCVVQVYFSSNILIGLWYCCSLCRRLKTMSWQAWSCLVRQHSLRRANRIHTSSIGPD